MKARIGARLSGGLRARVDRAARAMEMDRSAWVRLVLLRAVEASERRARDHA